GPPQDAHTQVDGRGFLHLGVLRIAIAPDGKTMASVGQDRTIRLWEMASGKEIRVIQAHEDTVRAGAFSPNGKTLATGSRDRTIRLWETATGKQIRIWEHDRQNPRGWITSVAFSPDGKTLATASFNDTIALWDPLTGEQIHLLKESGTVDSLA